VVAELLLLPVLEWRLVQDRPDPEHPSLGSLRWRPPGDEGRHQAPSIGGIVADGSAK
jgi:hypothetical protein